jgi:hypothetical protein
MRPTHRGTVRMCDLMRSVAYWNGLMGFGRDNLRIELILLMRVFWWNGSRSLE